MEARPVHTVLIVDDEEAVLKLIEHQLTGLPYAIIPTRSPAEAIHILKTMEIGLLLCDLTMPDIDGNQVMAAAREANPNIVSILVTGTTDHAATVRAINQGGIWKFISKPWRRDELVELVNEGVGRYASLCRQQALLKDLAREITEGREAAGKGGRPGIHEQETREEPVARPRLGKGFASSRYRLQEVVGEGGMGTVYKDTLLNMPVAVKVLGSRLTRDQRAVATLKEEARIAMQLSHRHIVRLHNLQKAAHNYFLVMEYVDGRNIRDVLDLYGKLPLDTVRQIVQVCADALCYAHRHGVLHRDLKPANLLLSRDGILKIIDFGVACLIHTQEETRHVLGTPVYMSPEQLRGEKLDPRTDVYSLGIITYQLLTGRPPFPENTRDADLLCVGPVDLPGLAPDVKRVVWKAIAADRDNRWESVDAYARALMDCGRASHG
jgi:CheY-like chemotaxis protein